MESNMRMKMQLADAMVYSLVSVGRGMTTESLAKYINEHRLHVRQDGQPVTSRQIYAVASRLPAIFAKEGGRILLIM